MPTAGCPICGSTSSTTLEDLQAHLDAHSKRDLIQLLLQQRQNLGAGTSRKPPSPCLDSESIPNSIDSGTAIIQYSTTDYEASLSQDATSQEECLSNSRRSSGTGGTYNFHLPHHSKSLASLQPLALVKIKTDITPAPAHVEDLTTEDNIDPLHFDEEVPLDTFSVPFHLNSDKQCDDISGSCASTAINDLRPTSYQTHEGRVVVEETSYQEVVMGSYPDNSSAGSTVPSDQDSQFKELVQEESDNATSQTSIIKYIIDQNGKTSHELPEDPQRWIIHDGRTIPVYSSFTQIHVGTKDERHHHSETSKIILEEEIGMNLTTDKIGAAISLNLMTDEEIGEISEFEESNTSLISEDSKAALSRSSSTFLKKEGIMVQRPKPKHKKRIKHGEVNSGHQFLCYECPVMQKFKSLFELIGHKVKLHPSIAEQFSDNNASSSIPVAIPLLSPVKDDHLHSNMQAKASKEFFCVYCTTTFDNKIALAKHMEMDHGDKPVQPNVFECNTCGKTFQARTNLRKHLLVHRERKHLCTTCSKGFTSNFKLLEHARIHSKVYPFKCDKCEKAYRTPSLLNYHMKNIHTPESERPVKQKVEFYCGICHKILRSKRSYVCHSKTHQASKSKCPYCCETFSRQSVLVRHIRITHDSQYESSESKDCPICHRKFHPNSMIKHMRIHANEKPYSCQVCSKRFRTYANLSSHSWSHTNVDKPFKCRICPKSYLFKRTLEHHMMVHKRRTLHYVCNECGVRFTNKVNMKRHLEEHYSDKKYKCTTCGKAFQRNYYLLEHERIHTGLKPFICGICGKASTTKSNHRAHIKIHDARDSTSQEG